MWAGTLYAPAAGLMGAGVRGPAAAARVSGGLAIGGALGLGLIALPLAWLDRRALRQLGRADWIEALKLATIGNLLYYLCLASAIQCRRAGAHHDHRHAAGGSRSAPTCARAVTGGCPGGGPSLALIALGIACVNQVELQALRQDPDADRAHHDHRHAAGGDRGQRQPAQRAP